MKKLFTGITIFLLVITSAYAENCNNICEELSGTAENFMRARQNGIPMMKAMDIARKITIKPLKKICKSMVIRAYEEPRWSTESNKQRAIEDFRDKIYLECVKSYNK